MSEDVFLTSHSETMKRIITVILAVTTLGAFAQDHGGKKDIKGEKADIKSNVSSMKRDVAEIEAMREAKAEYDVQMKAMNFDAMQAAKNGILKRMDKEIEQVRMRLNIDRAEMVSSMEEAQLARKEAARSKATKKPAAAADDRADARDDRADAKDDRSDYDKQMDLLIDMNRIFLEIRKIELTSKPQRHVEGSILNKTEEFIQLMQNDIFETRKEIREDRQEILEDRNEAVEEKKKDGKKKRK